jgi:hypothetical protein
MSAIRVPITIRVRNRFDLKGELLRHISPFTVRAMMKIGTFEGWAIMHDLGFMLLTNVKAGLEKPKKEFKAGDIAFLPINSSLWFFSKDGEVERPMNLVGEIKQKEELSKIGRGDYITLVVEERV